VAGPSHVVYFKYGTELVIDSVGPPDPSVSTTESNHEDIQVYDAETELRESMVRESISADEVGVGPEISESDRARLVDLILYRNVFAKNIFKLGCAMDIIESEYPKYYESGGRPGS